MATDSKGWTINNLYQIYTDEKLFVNRDYQRKLVWTPQEKEKLIDTIISGYPIPLILLAEVGDHYEIIDGMQRMNAIFSFLEQKFSLDKKFFDLEQNPITNLLLKEKKLISLENVALFSPRQCTAILQYSIPVTIFKGENDKDVNEVFERINSYGRKLSSQDRRQSLASTPISSLVREISSYIRDDYTEQIVPLSRMPSISIIRSKENDEEDGLEARDTFWVSNGVVTTKELLDSEDEKIVTDLLFAIANNGPTDMSKEILDKIYAPSSEQHQAINKYIKLNGYELTKERFFLVFDQIKEVQNSSPIDLRKRFRPDNPRNTIKTEFYALFMTFWDLIINKEMLPTNKKHILDYMYDSTSKFTPGMKNITKIDRDKNIKTMNGLITGGFAPGEIKKHLGSGPNLIKQFEHSMNRSNSESYFIELKQGIVNLDGTNSLNPDFFNKIAKTISAMANSCEGKQDAEIYIGIADKKEDAERSSKMYGIPYIEIHNRYITGIEKDIQALALKDIDSYERLLLKEIEKTPLQNSLKSELKGNIDIFKYKELHIVRIFIPRQKGVTSFNDKFFIRNGSNNDEFPIAKIQELAAKFI